MKPINLKELKKAYLHFTLHLIILISASLLCLYFFFAARAQEHLLLSRQVEEGKTLMKTRTAIHADFAIIVNRFNQLSRFSAISSEQMDNQAIMLADIQDANFRIKALLKSNIEKRASFALYEKLTQDVTAMAAIQDSLSVTRFQLGSLRTQLDQCLRVNRSVEAKLSRGLFR